MLVMEPRWRWSHDFDNNDDDNEDDDDDGDVGAVVGLEVDILAEEAEGYPLHPTYNPPHTVTE